MSVRQADQLPFETVGGGKDTQRQVLIGSEQSPHFAMRRFVMQPGGGMPRARARPRARAPGGVACRVGQHAYALRYVYVCGIRPYR